MKRLIKKATEWYHLTNDKNFQYNPYYENQYQQLGSGLYITPGEDVDKWYRALGGREYAVPVDISNLKIIDQNDIPEYWKLQKELADAGFTAEEIEQYMPTGNTLGENPFTIAQQIFWAKWKGYDAIRMSDTSDGQQIRVLDNANITFGEPQPILDVIRKYR